MLICGLLPDDIMFLGRLSMEHTRNVFVFGPQMWAKL